jgi:hypothetical protein
LHLFAIVVGNTARVCRNFQIEAGIALADAGVPEDVVVLADVAVSAADPMEARRDPTATVTVAEVVTRSTSSM